MSEIYKLSPIHDWHSQHGAHFILEAGWKRVESYGDAEEEASAVRRAAGICDVTPLTKLDVQGKDAALFLARHLPETVIPREGFHNRDRLSGKGESSEVQIARLITERFLVLGNPEARESLVARFCQPAGDLRCAHVTDLTSAFAGIRLAGPSSAEVLKKVCRLRLDHAGLLCGQCAQTPVARVGAVVMRDDLMGMMSYMLLVSRDYGEYVWKSLTSAGERHHIRHFGVAAERRLTRGITDVAAIQ